MTSSLSLICINNPDEFRMMQRQQKKIVQAATADLLATVALLEKALDGKLDDEAHAQINAAYFQVNQVQTTFDKLITQIDNIQLKDQSCE